MVPQNLRLSAIDQHTINLLNQSEALLERSRQVAKAADAAADRLRRISDRMNARQSIDTATTSTVRRFPRCPLLFVA
jgi:hypothetical protein